MEQLVDVVYYLYQEIHDNFGPGGKVTSPVHLHTQFPLSLYIKPQSDFLPLLRCLLHLEKSKTNLVEVNQPLRSVCGCVCAAFSKEAENFYKPKTASLGTSGLSLHYANIINQIDNLVCTILNFHVLLGYEQQCPYQQS
jgi:hypothetical protein